jgi:hypothetical protein
MSPASIVGFAVGTHAEAIRNHQYDGARKGGKSERREALDFGQY